MTPAEADCVFCGIVAGTIPARVVGRSDGAIAFWDIDPGAPFHIVVVPTDHLPNARALGEGDRRVVGELVELANTVAGDEGLADRGYRLVINVGPDGGQTVDHLHLHLLGGRAMEWPPG